MREPVPRRVVRRIAEPVAAGEVDDDAVGRRLDRGRALVIETEEDQVGAGGERFLVRHERGQPVAVPGQARVERGRRLAGKRV